METAHRLLSLRVGDQIGETDIVPSGGMDLDASVCEDPLCLFGPGARTPAEGFPDDRDEGKLASVDLAWGHAACGQDLADDGLRVTILRRQNSKSSAGRIG